MKSNIFYAFILFFALLFVMPAARVNAAGFSSLNLPSSASVLTASLDVNKEKSLFDGVYLYTKKHLEISMEETEFPDKMVFFASSGGVQEGVVYNGDIYLLNSDFYVNGTINGNIYSFFGNVKFGETAELTGKVQMFSSIVSVNTSSKLYNNLEIVSAIDWFKIWNSEEVFNDYFIYDSTVPKFWLTLAFCFVECAICLAFFAMRNSVSYQGAEIMIKEPLNVLKNGSTVYFLTMALIIVFSISVILIPLSFVVYFVMFLVMLWGEAALGIVVGKFVSKKLKKDFSIYYVAIGVVLIESLKLIPYVSFATKWIVLPLLSIGILATVWVNATIRNKFYETSYAVNKGEKVFSNDKIRDIVLLGVKDESKQ